MFQRSFDNINIMIISNSQNIIMMWNMKDKSKYQMAYDRYTEDHFDQNIMISKSHISKTESLLFTDTILHNTEIKRLSRVVL